MVEVPKRTFDRIVSGVALTRRGSGFFVGEVRRDFWSFNLDYADAAAVDTEDARDVYTGSLCDAEVHLSRSSDRGGGLSFGLINEYGSAFVSEALHAIADFPAYSWLRRIRACRSWISEMWGCSWGWRVWGVKRVRKQSPRLKF